MKKFAWPVLLWFVYLTLIACQPSEESQMAMNIGQAARDTNSVISATEFVLEAEIQLEELGHYAERVAWVNSNFITSDTEQLSAIATEAYTALQVRLATQAAEYNNVEGLDM